MLPPFIIEQIRRREEEERRRAQESVKELHLPQPVVDPRGGRKEPVEERGVVIIDLG